VPDIKTRVPVVQQSGIIPKRLSAGLNSPEFNNARNSSDGEGNLMLRKSRKQRSAFCITNAHTVKESLRRH